MSGLRRSLFGLGFSGPLAFVATEAAGVKMTPGYDRIVNSVSALSQAGAADAAVINAMFVVAALLQFLVGLALILRFRGHNRGLTAAGVLLGLYALTGAAIAAFFPMDPIGQAITLRGAFHLGLVGLSALALIGAMVLARHLPETGWFAGFTGLCLTGMATGAGLALLAEFLGWPILGLAERMTQLSYLTWLLVLAAIGFRAESEAAPR